MSTTQVRAINDTNIAALNDTQIDVLYEVSLPLLENDAQLSFKESSGQWQRRALPYSLSDAG